MPHDHATLTQNIAAVRRDIASACARAGRDPGDVTLVAVTKTVGARTVLGLIARGIRDFGENRTSALVEKRAVVDAQAAPPHDAASQPANLSQPAIRWHMIGHLQRNKVRTLLPHIDLLHSADSVRLLAALDAEVSRSGRPPLAVLLQVNVSGEETKGGFGGDELDAALTFARELAGIRVHGLMTMAPADADSRAVRAVFSGLRGLRDRARARGHDQVRELSMGMSGDYIEAVEEGATYLRVGSALLHRTAGS